MFLYRKVSAASLLETIIASVIILITYGYFMITFIQINRPDKKSKEIQSYYEQQIICDSLKALIGAGVDIRIGEFDIKYIQNTYSNAFLKASKEYSAANAFNYKSFTDAAK